MSIADATATPPPSGLAGQAKSRPPLPEGYKPPKDRLSHEEYVSRLHRLSGCIDDPTFMRPRQPVIERSVPFDDEPPLEPELLERANA